MTPNERLRQLREKRYKTSREAADAMGIKEATYNQHENDTRGKGKIPRDAAERYASFYRVTLDWLLTGKGDEPEIDIGPNVGDLERMIAEVIADEVTMQTRLLDLPRIVAPALHEQLERFRSDRASHPKSGKTIARGTSVQSPAPTKPSGPEE